MMIELTGARLIRESEKSLLVACEVSGGGRREIWFPRRHVTVDGATIRATTWIVSQRDEELSPLSIVTQ